MKKDSYLLNADREFFEQLDDAILDANCTRADFIRDAVIQKLKHHQTVMKPFFAKMKKEQSELSTLQF